MFIVVDGIDGAGKTTLVGQLSNVFSAHDPLVTKEPTDDSPWAKAIRNSAERGRLTVEEEIHLFHNDRLFHIESEIMPALKAERPVICDRYVDSTLAFQCSSPSEADSLFEQFREQLLIPDISFILNCPVEVGLSRIEKGRGKFTEFEKSSTLDLAATIYESRKEGSYVHLDASGSVNQTFKQALTVLNALPQTMDLLALVPDGEGTPNNCEDQPIVRFA